MSSVCNGTACIGGNANVAHCQANRTCSPGATEQPEISGDEMIETKTKLQYKVDKEYKETKSRKQAINTNGIFVVSKPVLRHV